MFDLLNYLNEEIQKIANEKWPTKKGSQHSPKFSLVVNKLEDNDFNLILICAHGECYVGETLFRRFNAYDSVSSTPAETTLKDIMTSLYNRTM